MKPENHKEELPLAFYMEKFRAMDPAEATARLGDIFRKGEFYVNYLGRELAISHPDGVIRAMDGESLPSLTAQTFLLRWLLQGWTAGSTGKWLTFREMPWGELYISAYTGRVLKRAAFTFGTRPEAFKKAALRLGGRPLSHCDAGFEFDFLGSYAMRILVWEGDEDFPPSAQILYSENFAADLTAEDRVVAGDLLISHIRSAM